MAYKLGTSTKVAFGGLASVALLCWLGFAWSMRGIALPSFEAVRQGYSTTEAMLLDRNREIIHELRVDTSARRLHWAPLGSISPALQSALIFSEDRRFYSHHGADWKALAAGLLEQVRGGAPRGASTITMQLASRLHAAARSDGERRSPLEKIRQIAAARRLEERWSKPQILEAYMNLVTFRGELQGVAAASQGLFAKQPHGLDAVESGILASLVRAPNAPVEKVAARTRSLSQALGLQCTDAEVEERVGRTLAGPYRLRQQAALAPHVARKLLGDADSARTVVCTLDGRLQQYVGEVLAHHVAAIRNQNVHDGAALVADNRTGEVLCYVGNLGERSSAPYVDGIQALRQAGSTLKPFLFGLALERRLLTAASLLDDSPVDIPVSGGLYRPKNYDRTFRGAVTLRTSLASSLNVPAVRTLNTVGVESFVERLDAFGFRRLKPADYYGPSLALGSADICLWDLVNAYRALANGGIRSPLRLSFSEAPGESRRALSVPAAFIIGDILSDRESRSETFNLESPLGTRFWTAVKTGTSKDMRDNWCVGYSARYTVGVWVGNFSGEPMWNVTGVTGAAPVWVEIMNRLHRAAGSSSPEAPGGVVAQRVEIAASGQVRKEWFVEGTQTESVQEARAAGHARIVHPADGTVIALDPDIPADRQRVFFEAADQAASLRWIIDGQVMGTADDLLLWSPSKGKHTAAIVDLQNRIADSVAFEVR